MLWWQWMIVGGVLLGAELFFVDIQFYLVFIGLSALLVGVAGALGIDMSLAMQWIAFGALALITMVMFRRRLYEKIRGNVEGFRESLAGESVSVDTDIEPGAETRLDYRGSKWTARNVGNARISGGSRARVVKSEGLTLHIEAE